MADQKISALTSYATPLNADLFAIVDTANAITKKVTWANVLATAKVYNDTLYRSITNVTLPQYGGTGIANNAASTITISGNYATTITVTGATAITFPTTGTLITNAVTTLSSLVSIGTITTGVWNGTVVTAVYGGTGVANNVACTVTSSGNYAYTRTLTGATNVTFPTTGTLSTLAGTEALTNKSINGMTITASTGTFTLTNAKTISFANSMAFAGTDSQTYTFPSATATIAGIASAQTMTNKRNQPRVYSTASNTSLTPEIDTYDVFHITALAGAITINNHSTSTPVDGEIMEIRLLDNATARAISFGTAYVAKAGVALPTTTTLSKNLCMLFEWNANLSKWNLMASGVEA